MDAVSVVLPWSTCPMVPTFTCVFMTDSGLPALFPVSRCRTPPGESQFQGCRLRLSSGFQSQHHSVHTDRPADPLGVTTATCHLFLCSERFYFSLETIFDVVGESAFDRGVE